MSQYVYSEPRIAKALGVSRDDVKAVRDDHLQKDAAWILDKKRKQILYSKEGIVTLLEFLQLHIPEKRPATPDGMTMEKLLMLSVLPSLRPDEVPGVDPVKAILRVVGIPTSRLTVLEANFVDEKLQEKFQTYDGGKVTVRVRSNVNFAVGAEIVCYHANACAWDYTGRYPRSKRDSLRNVSSEGG
ncbi:MAG: hypothetical protein ACYTEQ_03415 [Planctomycetota bacterium]|jgi:hypothetical protein